MTEILTGHAAPDAGRGVLHSMLRGVRGRCPCCGEGRLLQRYLKATPACAHCGEGYAHLRADDMPPWLTIMIVGHVVVPLLLLVEQIWEPALWLQMAVWPAVTVALMLLVLPRAKGAVLGLLWATGAGEREAPAEP